MATSLLLSFLTFCLLLRASTSQEDTCHSTFGFNVFHYYTSVLHRQKLQPLMNEGPQINNRDPSEPSFEFTGESGLVINDTTLTKRMASSLCSSNKLSLYSSVFFKKYQDGGTSLELYHINETFLGLSICRKVNEIYVTYRHGNRLRFETFPYKFSSGKWYKLAVMFSGNLLTVFVNCALLEKRIVPLPDYCPGPKINLNIIAGSGCLTKELSPCQTGFNGSLQNVELSISKSDNVKGCNESAQCPVCASFLTIFKKYVKLQNDVISLNDSLKNCSKTLSSVNCTNHHTQSSRSCIIHESSYPDGSFVKNSTGHICYCRDGVAQCIPSSSIQTALEEEEETQAKSTPSVAPAATQTCLPNDDFGVTVTLALGEKKYFPLPSTNQCGILTCKTFGTFLYNDRKDKSCTGVPSSHCNSQSLDDQKLAVCCNRCTICESELAHCPNNSSCVPKGVDYSCECNKGFVMTNSNTSCIDINECTAGTHNCPADATCENTIGSFVCKCSKGYTLSEGNNNTLQCIDINECSTGRAKCDNNSVCENTNGGYNCKCNDGYTKMNDGHCVAVCDEKCQNGGDCVSPNNCSCVPGFTGAQCQYDIDECKIGMHECTHNVSKCINTHGGYFCSCAEGYQWQWKRFKGYCVDVNECTSGIHYCPSLNNCQNVFEGYKCTCDGGNQCTGSCKYGDEYIPEGQNKSLGCDTCVCKEGNLICEKKPCNCDNDEDKKCCPQCFSKEFCQINDVNLEVGDYLIDDNDRCIRRQCLKALDNQLSVFDLSMECSPLADCPPGHSYIPEGGCCPVCQLPPCTATSRPPTVTTNHETCECNGNSWSCNETKKCPTHKELGCLKDELVQLPDQRCPICYTSVINELTCLS